MKSFIFLIFVFLLLNSTMVAQVGINTDNSSPNNSAMLDVKSTNKGLLTISQPSESVLNARKTVNLGCWNRYLRTCDC